MTGALLEQDIEATDAERDVRGGTTLWRYAARKAGGAAISLAMVVVLGFFAFRILPGDPTRSMTRGRIVSPEQRETIRRPFGVDEPQLTPVWIYQRGLPRGRLGESYTYRRPVSELIQEHLGATLLLTGVATLLAITLGLWIGQRSAWRRGTWFDRFNTGSAIVLWSVPTFWLGLILLLVFGGMLHWLPTGGMKTAGTTATGLPLVLDVARHMVMPVITMVAVTYAQYLLVMRASLLEEMHADYLVTARAKGLREDLVRKRHAVPNALLPTVTLVFLHLGGLVAGAVTVEAIFSWPGLGYLTYAALTGPDLPLLQGTFVVFSSIVILMNLVADLLYRFLDPRVRAA